MHDYCNTYNNHESSQLIGLQLLQLELKLGRTPSRSFRPLKSAENSWQIWISCSHRVLFALDCLGASGNPLCGFLGLTLVDSLVPVMAHETKHRYEQKLHHLEEALPEAPLATATFAVRNAYTRSVAEQQEVAYERLLRSKGAPWLPHALVLGVNLILTSLSKDYDQFVQKYNMHSMGKTIPELDAMLKLAKKCIPKKALAVLAIRQELKKNKDSMFGTSSIFTIELYSFPKTNPWIYDIGCGTHTYNIIQGLRGIRKLNKGALDLYVGNGNRATFKSIWRFDLILPNGMVLVLDNCHFAPSITRGVISLSHLWDNGFLYKITDYGAILVFKDNLVYFNAIPRDDIFEIDMHNHVSNKCSIYTCSNKKFKHNLDSTFLWHCRLGHINKKRIAKLQHDRLLKSNDGESFDVCVSCISGKMARKPFTYADERANNLLGLILSDGCEALVKRDRPNKLESKSIKCIFVGYPKEMMGYYFYYPPENKIFVARYAEFFKNNLISQEASRSIEHDLVDHVKPTGYRAALLDPDYDKWLEAINAEMQSMKDNQVWNLVDLPPDCKIVGSKWIFKKTIDMDGNIHTYKARLIAKCFTQTYGGYEETFSPIADIKAIRILIAITSFYDYYIWQIDVKTAFLNGHLNEDIYMVQPKGFMNPKHLRRVCKRSIYELKQAPRSWQEY
ncbi:retrotransposon protein, putative, ty1-copia subclass [Tanacetum coccineum]|uniref:Retrotransposon protein, putative, ty1-copia subclass n=1 Tax=Tanacetum coccineum TaxID=301880 RepID=A0ABQ5HSD4_9ASTR